MVGLIFDAAIHDARVALDDVDPASVAVNTSQSRASMRVETCDLPGRSIPPRSA